MLTDTAEFEYQLDNEFFAALDAPEVQKGQLEVTLNVRKTSGVFLLDFHTEGVVTVVCDRCLDEMEQAIETDDRLKVKLGEEYDETDDMVIVPEEEGYINVAWFIYEFIALSIPMKHVHAPGKCNKDMVNKLSKHLRVSGDEEDEFEDLDELEKDSQSIDPRWNELKKILDNN